MLMINLPFEYAEKQHFKISSSDLIPSLGQKTAEQGGGVEMEPQESCGVRGTPMPLLRLFY